MKRSILNLAVVLFLSFNQLSTVAFAQYTKLYDFAGTDGKYPQSTLYSDGVYLYGTTYQGGAHNAGTLFKIKSDGTGYSDLLDFSGYATGGNPWGSLTSDGNSLYGMTEWGGTNGGGGVIYKIMPDGSGYTMLFMFAGTGTDGRNPRGSLYYDGTFLYGMTYQGGTNNQGTIFKIKPDGTMYSKILDFAGATNGSNPYGSLISDGVYLYGMTSGGGSSNYGVIFKINKDGSGYTKLLDFTGTANGNNPYSSLISIGSYLYGTTSGGGANGGGVVFKIKPDGTGYTDMLDLAGPTNISNSWCSLVSDGTFLYGMTTGGTNNKGSVFKIKPDGSEFSKMIDFLGANGSDPYTCSLIFDGTFLYGMTYSGGINGFGTIFKLANVTGIAENHLKIDFNVFPNPSSGKFQVQVTSGSIGKFKMEIYNILGDKVFELPDLLNQQSDIDLGSMPNGVYFLKLETEQGAAIKKIIINNNA